MEKHSDGNIMFYAKDRKTWRSWLLKHGTKQRGAWLIYYKPISGKTRISYNDAVDEAICFGWIDSKPNKLDEFSSIQFFAPRNPKSNWSKVNKARVKRLLKENKMTPAGFSVIEQAKANGSWDALNEVEEIIIPEDLMKALKKIKNALRYFENFPKSSKKNILEWIHNAKQEETRIKRIEETTRMAAQNIRANHYRQPKGKRSIG